MPKIIENVRENIIEEAKKQVMEQGYQATTIRSVASACNIATGTLYNYFSSKEMMVAAFMSLDWHAAVEKMRITDTACGYARAVKKVHDVLSTFVAEHGFLFGDESARAGFAGSYFKWHALLVRQIADILKPVIDEYAKEKSDYLSELIAESLISATMSGKDFAEYIKITKQLFN